MPIHSIFRLKNHVLLMALAAAYPVISHAAGAAKIDFSAGAVTAVNAAGVQRPVAKGSEIGSGDSVATGDGGRAQLRFTDGGMVSLQPGSEFKVDNYHFSGKEDGEEKGFFSLLKGGLRTITGLVGRTNKSAYKVTTNVATIGIRGTEFTIAYTGANSIAVSTCEGMIEVCNNAGCALVPAGSSAIVSGPNTEVKRSEVKPRLDPAQPGDDVRPVFSTSDNRQGNGLVAPVSPPLVSGAGYSVAYIEQVSSYPYLVSGSTTTFGGASELRSFTDGSDLYSATNIAGSFSADGVIGWGRWSSGTASGSLTDLHYVVGMPTPDITALGNLVATYQLVGFTLPTSTSGVIGQSPSGKLEATFSGGYATLGLDMKVPIGGVTYNLIGTGSNSGPGSPQFSVSSSSGVAFDAKGFFAGSNASHAGLVYKFNGAVGDVSGAAAFKR